jgi:hypothetical protein
MARTSPIFPALRGAPANDRGGLAQRSDQRGDGWRTGSL